MQYSQTLISMFALAASMLSLNHGVQAHTWAEVINLINDDGTLIQPDGFQRSYFPRGDKRNTASEASMYGKIEPGAQAIDTAKICPSFQAQPGNTPGFDRLKASPGSNIAIRYAENGHVNKIENGRPDFGGKVWVYGSQKPQNPKFLDVVNKWNADGSGGDKSGKLLTTEWFDDGRCYEAPSDVPNPNATIRAAAAPFAKGQYPVQPYGGLLCQTNFRLPDDAVVGQPYTVFWAWNFSMVATPQQYEYFTFCLDVDVVEADKSKGKNKADAKFNAAQPVGSAAVSQYYDNLVKKKVVEGTPPVPIFDFKSFAPASGVPGPGSPVPTFAPAAAPGAPPSKAGSAPAAQATTAKPTVLGETSAGQPVVPPAAPAPQASAPTQAPAAQASAPPVSGLPSISVPMSLLSASASVNPAVSAQPSSAAASQPSSAAAPSILTVTATHDAFITKTVTMDAPVSTVYVNASDQSTPTTSFSTVKMSQGTGAAAETTPHSGGAYDRRRFVPPVISPSPSRAGSAKFRLL